MKKTAYLSALSLILLGGCSFSNDALFPSLFGSDEQEQIAKTGDIAKAEEPQVVGTKEFEPLEIYEGANTGTFVGQKVISFRKEISQLQTSIKDYNAQLQNIRGSVTGNAIAYHKIIGLLEAKLQVGTTPGNPQMYALLQQAQAHIATMDSNTVAVSQLAQKVSSDGAMTSYLLDSIKAAYSVSGAVDEDHRQLKILEGEANQTAFLFNSLLNELASDSVRQQQYIEAARNYIAEMNNAIKAGSFVAKPMPLNRNMMGAPMMNMAPNPMPNISDKPLFTVKFNRDDVNYKDALKGAVKNAKERKPDVMFEVVAVSPAGGSMVSLNSAKNKASEVFDAIVEQDVSAEKVSLSAKTMSGIKNSEVQVFVK